jgi:hypothetical protein
MAHSNGVPLVVLDDPKIGFPSPPKADHHPQRNGGTMSRGMATSNTPPSTNGTGQM